MSEGAQGPDRSVYPSPPSWVNGPSEGLTDESEGDSIEPVAGSRRPAMISPRETGVGAVPAIQTAHEDDHGSPAGVLVTVRCLYP